MTPLGPRAATRPTSPNGGAGEPATAPSGGKCRDAGLGRNLPQAIAVGLGLALLALVAILAHPLAGAVLIAAAPDSVRSSSSTPCVTASTARQPCSGSPVPPCCRSPPTGAASRRTRWSWS